MWSIDGTEWDVPCTIERTSEMTSSEISGMMLDKTYFNDVIGTYLKYDIKLAVPKGWEHTYTELYKVLTDPIGVHVFVLPYSDGIVTINGRIDSVKDVYVRKPNGKMHWRGIAFTVQASTPTKMYELGELLQIGLPPLPNDSGAAEGTTYVYVDGDWQYIDDAEDNYY